MPEDQKNRTVQRNYIGSHKQRRVIYYDNIDEQDDGSIDTYDSDDEKESTGEIKGKELVKYSQKSEVPFAY